MKDLHDIMHITPEENLERLLNLRNNFLQFLEKFENNLDHDDPKILSNFEWIFRTREKLSDVDRQIHEENQRLAKMGPLYQAEQRAELIEKLIRKIKKVTIK